MFVTNLCVYKSKKKETLQSKVCTRAASFNKCIP